MIVPGSINPLLLTSAAAAGGLQVSRSLRFNGTADSAYLNRTPAVAGNRRTWTWSAWVKRSYLNSSGATYQQLFSAGSSGGVRDCFFFDTDTDDTLAFYSVGSGFGGGVLLFRTNAVFRDMSAWYHIVLAVDTTQATAANRIKLYINGVEQTFSTTNYPSQNSDGLINSIIGHALGRDQGQAVQYFDGYLTNIHLIDGQQLTPSSFTEVSATTGQLIPKAYSGGSYGTNGFYLKFDDNSTTAALGTDSSGNGNTWTTNNFSVTAGAGNDSLLDTPTSYGTDTGVGGEVRGNYATLNPLQSSGSTLANGNLDCTTSVATGAQVRATIAVSSSKWYWEVTVNTSVTANNIGIIKTSEALVADRPGYFAGGYAYVGFSGNKENNASASAYGATYGSGDVIGVALDLTAGTLVFYKNGASQGTAYSSLTGEFIPCIGDGTGGSGLDMNVNFGQRAFAYTAPSGFKALVDTNIPVVVAKPNTLMDVVKYDGNGTTQTISGLGFEPDLIWIKGRSIAQGNSLYDAIRGFNKKVLSSDSTSAEVTETGGLNGVTSTGFTLDGNNTIIGGTNGSSATYVGWCWDAGTSTVSNTQGSITSQVRANPTAGFSVITYTGGGVDGSVGHGLGVAPKIYIVKNRSAASNWPVAYTIVDGSLDFMYLNLTNAAGNATQSVPTSTVINLQQSAGETTNGNNYVIYAFAPVVGYSSFGSYTGNGSSSGPFVYTGFRPRWLLVKNSNNTDGWSMWDAARDPYNEVIYKLEPNSSGAEGSNSVHKFDFLSNGFKVRGDWAGINGSGNTIIYAAFAESPFQYARAR